jgi:small-conductance mechanosensitive channel
VYAKWIAQVRLQHRIVTHLILQSLAGIAALVLGAVLVWWVVQMLLDRAAAGRSGMDMRSMHTLRTVATLAIEVVTLVLVLLVVFGVPNQVPTILGLGAAGLTVVFQDFILAFFGWFVLMGRNGIRVGDWVEINGVGGEVVEIGLFRTALLETGNWTDKGHPTGRRVTFINSFAVTGQFFNFSTAGQWMWDQISVNVPTGEGTYKTIEAIHKAVLEQTEKDAKLAEAEWKGSNKMQGLGQFSATPSVDMRPAASGIDILVRYVTRAADRFEMRNKLYQTVIELLHKPDAGQAEVAGAQK